MNSKIQTKPKQPVWVHKHKDTETKECGRRKLSLGDEVALTSPHETSLHQYSDYESAPRGILQTQEFVIDSAS